LRERLADAFIRFSGISTPWTFLSDVLGGEHFQQFVERLRTDAHRFREIYNNALDRFAREFRFRYRSFPFPKLRTGELPLWVVKDGKRHQFNERLFEGSDLSVQTVLPKASPLTLFLRRHHCSLFVHGVGGANYEWVNDRILEEFFGVEPPPYFVMSGTFHPFGDEERDVPYFFMAPDSLRAALHDLFMKSGKNLPVDDR
jgi:hypothetical protein